MRAKQIFSLTVICMLFGCATAWLSFVTAQQTPVVGNTIVTIEINKGDSFKRITDKLTEQHVNITPLWFKLIAFQQKTYLKLKAGEYDLSAGMTMPQILLLFAQGKTKKHAITFPEGWSFQQFLDELQKNPNIEHNLSKNSDTSTWQQWLNQQNSPYTHPEGLFFPDTYYFSKHTSDSAILKMAYEKMQQVLAQEWQKKADSLPVKSAYEALILASIIEKETGVASERPQIAGVFSRRLQTDMLLQTDPTVIYGMGANYHGNISHEDLITPTAYNTYQTKGLPPTPIAMPGQAAIHAALHPDNSTNLYFVAKGDGTHVFSSTLEAHNQAVNLYQRKQP
ncbi:endolytic transglycosylase MltG [Methylosoma difficile]